MSLAFSARILLSPNLRQSQPSPLILGISSLRCTAVNGGDGRRQNGRPNRGSPCPPRASSIRGCKREDGEPGCGNSARPVLRGRVTQGGRSVQ